MGTIVVDCMTFQEKLWCAMKAQRYSQKAIAKLMGVSQGLVSGWTRGKYIPDIYQAKQLANILGVSLDFLVDDVLDYPPVAVNEAESTALDLIRTHGFSKAEVIVLLTRRKLPTIESGQRIPAERIPDPRAKKGNSGDRRSG